MFWIGLAAGFILGGALGLVIGGFMGRRSGEAESDADHQRRQNQAIRADQERADDIEKRADEARAALAGDKDKLAGDGASLAGRLHASGRGRTTRK